MHDHQLLSELKRLRTAEPPPVDVVDRVLRELPRLRLEHGDLPPARQLWMIAAAALSAAIFALGGVWHAGRRAAPSSEEALVVAGGLGDAAAGLLAPLAGILDALPVEAVWNALIDLVSSYSPYIVAFAVTGTVAATVTVALVVARDFKHPVVREDAT